MPEKQLTDEQFATLSAKLQAMGRPAIPREEASEMLLFWSFEQILRYYTR